MKKKLVSAALALCMVFGSAAALPQSAVTDTTAISASAATTYYTYGNYRYKILSNGTVEIFYFHNKSKTAVNAVVPATIGGKKVTSIDISAFWGENVTAITIPEGVTNVGSSAFAFCTAKTITIPSTVTKLQSNAFRHCPNLTAINVSAANKNYASVNGSLVSKDKTKLICAPTGVVNYTVPSSVKSLEQYSVYESDKMQVLNIPNSVTAIKAFALEYNKALKTINIGTGVTSINGYLLNNTVSTRFYHGCDKLENINVNAGNKTYASAGGVLYNKKKTILLRCPDNKAKVSIAASTNKIEDSAFGYCKALTSVYIPNSVKTIEEFAFNNCTALKSAILPYGLTELDTGVFNQCTSLTSISIPNGVKKVYSAFSGCKKLTSVNIPNTVESIYSTAFSNCSSLKDVYIPSSVKNIYSGAVAKNVVIYGQKGSAAEAFAKKNGNTFKVISQPLTRFAGAGRFDTSKTISAEGGFKSAKTVVLAYGLNYADALAGVPLATKLNAPILLTNKDSIPDEVLGEIKRLGAKEVVVLGGEGAISKNVVKTLQNNKLTVKRYAGTSRFGTATKIAAQLNAAPKEIFFVYGLNYADALSVSTVAALKNAPIIYLKTNGELDKDTAAYLASLKKKGCVKNAYVIGGKGVISDAMMKKAGSALGLTFNKTITRVAGANRYATCVSVNNKFKGVLSGKSICIAKGLDFPDALAGGVFAAKNKAPLFLADNKLTAEQTKYLKAKKASKLYVFGGTGAVPNSLVQSIGAASV